MKTERKMKQKKWQNAVEESNKLCFYSSYKTQQDIEQ